MMPAVTPKSMIATTISIQRPRTPQSRKSFLNITATISILSRKKTTHRAMEDIIATTHMMIQSTRNVQKPKKRRGTTLTTRITSTKSPQRGEIRQNITLTTLMPNMRNTRNTRAVPSLTTPNHIIIIVNMADLGMGLPLLLSSLPGFCIGASLWWWCVDTYE